MILRPRILLFAIFSSSHSIHVVWADPPSKSYSSRQPDKELTAETNFLSSSKQRSNNTFSVSLLHLISPAGRKFRGGKNMYGAGSPWEGWEDRGSSHGPHSAGDTLGALHLPGCSLAMLLRKSCHRQQLSSLYHGFVQRCHALPADIPNAAATEKLLKIEKY